MRELSSDLPVPCGGEGQLETVNLRGSGCTWTCTAKTCSEFLTTTTLASSLIGRRTARLLLALLVLPSGFSSGETCKQRLCQSRSNGKGVIVRTAISDEKLETTDAWRW